VAHLIDPLLAFVSNHAALAYLTIFLAALLEAIPIAGSVIPGTTIILALSALVPGGELRLQWVLLAAIIGAVLGDGGAYWIGHRQKREILTTWPFSSYPRLVAQSEAFFHRFGTLAIFFARFVAPIRAVVPITAGALDVPPVRFYAVNIPAIVLWACAHVLPGVFAVELIHRYGNLPHHSHIAKPIWIALVVVGSVVAGLGLHLYRRRREQTLMAKALNRKAGRSAYSESTRLPRPGAGPT
jgi:membrane protein DedA with SNARE-associated domain